MNSDINAKCDAEFLRRLGWIPIHKRGKLLWSKNGGAPVTVAIAKQLTKI